MNKEDLEMIRTNPERTVLIIVNELSKEFEEKTARNILPYELRDKTVRLILIHLTHKDGITQKELMRVTHMKGATVSVAVTKLEAYGYLRREANEYDMRSVRVYITKKGKEIAENAKSILDEKNKRIMHGISERDIRAAKYVLEKMLDNLVEE